MLNNDNWTRRIGDGISSGTYWGYATPGTPSGTTGWAIRRWITDGSDALIQFANDCGSFENIWSERIDCFSVPASAVTILETGSTSTSIWARWNRISGVSRYLVKITDSNGVTVGKWNDWTLTNEYNARMDLLPPSTTYNVTITAKNKAGSKSKTITISTTS